MTDDNETLGGISIVKIKAIDARLADTPKVTNEKLFKVNMTMNELADKLMQDKPKETNKC